MNLKKMPLIQVIGPVFNEEAIIELFCKRLINTLAKLEKKYFWEIIFVLDKSNDKSYEILRNLCKQNKRIKLVYLSSRFGHQMSLLAGIDNADGDIVIMMDTDLQHPPEIIPQLIKEYESGKDIVAGIRNMPGDSNILKKIGSRYFYSIMRFFSNINIKNGEADFRLISKSIIEIFKNDIREQNQFLRGLFSWVGFEKSYVMYNVEKRLQGESKYNWKRTLAFASSGIISFSKKPLRYAVFVGLFFSTIGLIFAVYTLFNYLIYKNLPPGWTTLSLLISILGGMQLLFLGVLGEYIGYIFEQVKGRPLYIVKEKINFK